MEKLKVGQKDFLLVTEFKSSQLLHLEFFNSLSPVILVVKNLFFLLYF